jgi:hypothetical protein
MTEWNGAAALEAIGLPGSDPRGLPASTLTFPDGAHYRVEIPSTEGPAALEAVLDEAARLGVPVTRVSQGSGVFMHTDAELDEMARLASDAGIEVSLFARPNAGWSSSAMARSAVGALIAPAAYGADQLAAVVDDMLRAAARGFRSVLLQDAGALYVFGELRSARILPADMQAKVSVMLPVANPAAARVVERLGASTINLPTDLALAEIAAIRSTVSAPLDVYVECPDNLGGFVRYQEIPRLIQVASPVYLKFGLRGTVDPYPAGRHVEAAMVANARERVRRARLGLDLLERSRIVAFRTSEPRAAGLAIPVVVAPLAASR